MPTAPGTYEEAVKQFAYPEDFREEALRVFPNRKKLHIAIAQNQDVGRLLRDMVPDDPEMAQAAAALYNWWKELWPNRYNFLPPAISAKALPPGVARPQRIAS